MFERMCFQFILSAYMKKFMLFLILSISPYKRIEGTGTICLFASKTDKQFLWKHMIGVVTSMQPSPGENWAKVVPHLFQNVCLIGASVRKESHTKIFDSRRFCDQVVFTSSGVGCITPLNQRLCGYGGPFLAYDMFYFSRGYHGQGM